MGGTGGYTGGTGDTTGGTTGMGWGAFGPPSAIYVYVLYFEKDCLSLYLEMKSSIWNWFIPAPTKSETITNKI